MGFQLFCAAMIALVFGLVVIYGGYRLFMVLLPIWGFVFGFGLGAQTLQYLFGGGFLSTVSAWVAGFLVGAAFALLSYFIYLFAVAVLAGSIGYALGVSFMLWLGVQSGFFVWIVGILLAALLIVLTLVLNIQKYVIIIGTAILGSGLVIGTLMLGILGLPLTKLLENPIQTVLSGHWFMILLFLLLVGTGIYVQIQAKPMAVILEEEEMAPTSVPPMAAAAPVAAASVVAMQTQAEPEAAPPPMPPAAPVAAAAAMMAAEPEEAPAAAAPMESQPVEAAAPAPAARPRVPIDTIEGVGSVYAAKLKDVGILFVADLLTAGASRQGREALVQKTGISAALILKWVNMADLMRVPGIGEEFSELLEAAGVDTVKELRNRNAENLYQAMLDANQQRKLVRRTPYLSEVQSWVENAKKLDTVMTY